MKKILFVATVVKGHIDVFHLPYLKMFKEKGWETSVAAKNNFEKTSDCVIPYCDNYYDIPFERNPFKLSNLNSYKELKKLITEGKYDIIHCHTPVGGVITRLVSKNSKENTARIIYTAHGFHFFKGAPLKNWLIYYPIEKYLSSYTDVLITMNQEDFDIVSKKFKNTQTIMTPGIGVDLEKFGTYEVEKNRLLRVQQGFNEKDFILIYVGELSSRKNQNQIIETANLLQGEFNNIKFLLVGTGKDSVKLKKKVQDLNLTDIVIFLGYRKDIVDLMNLADVIISTSKQEGLPVNLLEGLSVGKPIIATNSRGNRDLVKDNYNGFLLEIHDSKDMSDKIIQLYCNKDLQKKMSVNSKKESKKYDIKNVLEIMEKIYFV